MKKAILIMVMMLLVSIAFAAWSDSPNENLKLTNATSFEEVIPKIAYAPNGNVWVSWFSGENGNYNVRAQMFDFDGNITFAEGGILVSDHPQMSWLTDWDMKVDSQGNAIIVFLDERTGSLDIYAYKISPTGEFLWGEDGIALCNDSAEDYTPTLGITDQDNAIVAWMTDDDTRMQKVMANGTLAFTSPMVFHEDGVAISWAEILPRENDSFIFRYAKDSGPFWAVTRHLMAQKYDSNLQPVWAQPTVITDQGGISSWTQHFPTAPDGEGGFVICWHEDRDMNNMSNVYVQHVMADGSVGFAANGIQPTGNFSTQHFYPTIAYDQNGGETWLSWMETNEAQGNRGIRVQRIDSNGNSLFGLDGYAIVQMGNNAVLPFSASFQNNEYIAAFTSDINGDMYNSQIIAYKLDNAGDFVWESNFVPVKTVSSSVVHIAGSALQSDQLVFAWEDNRSGTNIYLQNLNFDGTLGIAEHITAIEGTVTLNFGNADISNVLLQIGEYNLSPNEQGYYYLELPAGTYSITASLPGYYDTFIENVVIVEGEITQQDIELEVIVATDTEMPSLQTKINNYPNPFNPNTTISFNIAEDSNVRLDIYNAKGQLIKNIKDEFMRKGAYNVQWNGIGEDGKPSPSGIYLVRLLSKNKALSHKMLMLK
ncbi:MAG TPA: carboxypeptidase regulatory-like domain-containing protein [Candidatus Cloacimonadota bacterium]|jgi:hypothetical protein|nr:carboxypeptidase regulatory-like domain-containing protein [Candidatus Cloacimonadales bacterium]HPY96414.1 carboxypeptidase regulatory-like domain-containing protein [Candidatus Cloacimonadota bacterium]HQB41013.1 carboxypeptidase regulatory-like domain-containing protein [Candidatus Cloacimonadota bacterium]